MTQPVTAIILAGGDSSRMAVPKAFLKVGGISMIGRVISAMGEVFEETLIVAGDQEAYRGLGPRVVPDSQRFRDIRGPMTGLFSGLSEAKNQYSFVVGCDMPFVAPALVGWIARQRDGHDVVVPVIGGYTEPLFGIYSKAVLPVLERALTSGLRSLHEIFRELNVLYVTEETMRPFDPHLRSFINVNTPADLAFAEGLADGV